MARAYKVVDVFTQTPLRGNPVAVILDTDGLDTPAMQAIAAWTNLSETTFLLPATNPDADYKLRIFTPRAELPFAGHPTLGSAHAAIEAKRATPRDGRLVMECGVGLVNLTVTDGEGGSGRQITLTLPPATVKSMDEADVDELDACLGGKIDRSVPPAIIDVGPVWIVAMIPDAEDVLALEPDFARMTALNKRLTATAGVSVFGMHQPGSDGHSSGAMIEVRSFAPAHGVNEDPVCGSGNGSVAVFQHVRGLLKSANYGVVCSYIAIQGGRLGRLGRIAHNVDGEGEVEIGGGCVTTVDGTLRTDK